MSLSSNFPNLKPALNLDFLNVGRLDPRVTFTRASTATYFDQLGVLQSASNDVARFDYNPSTLAPNGLLIEEQRTNSIRNNTMQGAVAGTPGTLPTNWVVTGSANGITREIVGAGTENGISYLDIRYSGTPTTNVFLLINTEANTQITAANGQSWAASWFVRLVGGSTSNIGVIRINMAGYTAAGAGVSGQGSLVDIQTLISANALQTQRYSTAITFSSASVERANTNITITGTTGNAIDITLRIGLPQLEQGSFATSVIPTTTTALTRSADVASMTGTNFSSWYNASEGTIVSTTQLANTVAANRAGYDINDNSTNNRIIFRVIITGGGDQSTIRSGGITQVQDSTATAPTTAVRKSAIAYKVNDFAFVANAGTVVADSSGAVPVAPTQILIGSAQGGVEFTGGYIQRISYYPTRLTNAQLQALTG